MTTTTMPCRATRSSSPQFSTNHRASFARQAAIEAFGHRAHWALDDSDFKDRLPKETPALAAEVLSRLELLGVEAAE